MTDDKTRNQNILQEQAWLFGNQIKFAVTCDFVIDPQNGCYMYAPGWQNTPRLDWNNVYVSYFSLLNLRELK
jgi:hypothetical protein